MPAFRRTPTPDTLHGDNPFLEHRRWPDISPGIIDTLVHELRDTLHLILGYSQLISMGCASPDAARRIEDSGRYQLDMIGVLTDMLCLPRADALARESLRLDTLLEAAVDACDTLRTDHHVTVAVDVRERWITTDSVRFSRLLRLLMAEAVRLATPSSEVLAATTEDTSLVVVAIHAIPHSRGPRVGVLDAYAKVLGARLQVLADYKMTRLVLRSAHTGCRSVATGLSATEDLNQ